MFPPGREELAVVGPLVEVERIRPCGEVMLLLFVLLFILLIILLAILLFILVIILLFKLLFILRRGS